MLRWLPEMRSRTALALLFCGLLLSSTACLALGMGGSSFPEDQPGTLPGTQTGEIPASAPTNPPASSTTVEEQPDSAANPTAASPTMAPGQLTRYHLAAELDYAERRLSVIEQVEYTNMNARALDDLLLIIEPQRLAHDFTLHSLVWHGAEPVDPYSLQEGLLFIPLPEPLQPGESLALELAFSYRLPGEPASLGSSARQENLADWYAFLPPYHPETGWWVLEPALVGEHLLYDIADFDVHIRLSGSNQALVIAAPAQAEMSGSIFTYTLHTARNFAWSVSPDYQVLSDAAGSTQLRAYVFPEHIAAGQMALSYMREAMQVFTQRFGDAGLPMLTIVEAEFPDGMEYDGLFFLNQAYFAYPGVDARSGLCSLSVHETAHQWWYRLVGNDPARQPWLDEALCTFSELLFYETNHPELVDWWWGYRIEDYAPQGWVNSSIYEHQEYRPYVNAVYLRGARFLDALRDQAGNEAFGEFLRQYASQYRNRIADAAGFFTLLQTITGQDFQPILDEYFQSR